MECCPNSNYGYYVMLNPERVILNLVQNLQGRLVSASNKSNVFRDPETSSG